LDAIVDKIGAAKSRPIKGREGGREKREGKEVDQRKSVGDATERSAEIVWTAVPQSDRR
jgi:hypothetical protein